MAIANPFKLGKVADLSAEINVIPNQWGIINSMGLFRNEYKSQKTVLVPRNTEEESILVDRNWDERNSVITGNKRDVLPVVIPHFPADDAITPNDVDGMVDWDSLMQGGNAPMTVEKVRMEKMERLRRAHALTLERARAQLVKDGSVYAPNGTVVTNFYTEFGVARETVFFDLASTTVNPLVHAEEAYAKVQDNYQSGEVITEFVALCSSSFFTDLVTNPFVYESYQYFAQTQGTAVLNGRLTAQGLGLDARARMFYYGGIWFIEARGKLGGVDYVEADKAYMFPLGTDSFRTYFAPANRFSTVNRAALESYMFEYRNEKDDIIEIMSETNFVNALLRPQAVITLSSAAS